MDLRFHFLYCLLLIHTGAVAKPVRSRPVFGSLQSQAGMSPAERLMFKQATDCGVQGEFFHVSRTQTNWIQKGFYFLIRKIEDTGLCNDGGLFSDPRLRSEVKALVERGEQIAVYSAEQVKDGEIPYTSDAIVFPAGNALIRQAFDRRLLRSKPVMILSPRIDFSVFKHERRHLIDFTNGLPERLYDQLSVMDLDHDATIQLAQFVIESRGYGEELRSLFAGRRFTEMEEVKTQFWHFYGRPVRWMLDELYNENFETYVSLHRYYRRVITPSDWKILDFARYLPDSEGIYDCEADLAEKQSLPILHQ